jgi:hypothetical protein
MARMLVMGIRWQRRMTGRRGGLLRARRYGREQRGNRFCLSLITVDPGRLDDFTDYVPVYEVLVHTL